MYTLLIKDVISLFQDYIYIMRILEEFGVEIVKHLMSKLQVSLSPPHFYVKTSVT